MKKCKYPFRFTGLKFIEYAALVVAVITSLMLADVLFSKWCSTCFAIPYTPRRIKSTIGFCLEYKELFVVVFSSISLYVAIFNLRKYVDAATINCLATLRERFNTPEKKSIHSYLLPEKEPILKNLDNSGKGLSQSESEKIPNSNVELFDYLGTIELGAIMLRKHLISYEEFYNQFGYRIENCIDNDDVRHYICDESRYYEDFIEASEKICARHHNEHCHKFSDWKLCPDKSASTPKQSSKKIAKCIILALISTAGLSCTAEDIRNATGKTDGQEATTPKDGTVLSGSYALDDGSGLTKLYLSFTGGKIYEYSCYSSVVLAEGYLWNTTSGDFFMRVSGECSVTDGILYRDGIPCGQVRVSGDLLMLDGLSYRKFAGFKSERYSVISVEGGSRITCDLAAQTLTIPVTLKTIPSGKLTVTSNASWAVPGEWKDGLLTVQVQEHSSVIARTAMLTLSYPEAEDVAFAIEQEYQSIETDPTAANCYVISTPGTRQIKAVYGNSKVLIKNIASVEVLWESFGTSTAPSIGDIIQSVSYSPGSGSSAGAITLSTPSTLKNGNAVIAAKDAYGTILWSWHIWVCKDYDPAASAQTYYNNAGVMMDRNLGATSATPGSVGALGLLYQWGRKDPFLGSSSISSDTKANSTLSWPYPVRSNSSNGTIAYATAHPTTYIFHNEDWYYTGSSSTDNTRWQSRKTIYDPCPPGWRVPDGGPNGVWSKAVGRSSPFNDYPYDSTNKGMNFSGKFGSTGSIWYPAAGYLYYYDGSLSNVGDIGHWWSCTPNDYDAYYLGLSLYGDVGPSVYYVRAGGRSVRCLQE